ncbi:type III secretion apparatus protein OrgA/MxiK [Cupriavidus sp. YR651]|uniref:hypothetical protein n=1 Tax=Cupriavidus sp. YR651 TaxID=1855315 RepID=UPI00087F3465|nr:hypothetical protein [Cupriavidus sp. YR651]SDD38104.1 type III secretion apparatus protein OrgA/MxiK [Cupriavidus sp. YR651]
MSLTHTAVSTTDRILYDPASYLHASRLNPRMSTRCAGQRAALSRIVMAVYGLSDGPAPPRTPADRTLADCWWELPIVCMLAGAHCLRGELIGRGQLSALPPALRHFALLQFPNVEPLPQTPRVPATLPAGLRLQHAGLAALGGWLRSTPVAWQQRIPLMFSTRMPADVLESRGTVRDMPPFLIQQVIQYAKSHRDISPDIA